MVSERIVSKARRVLVTGGAGFIGSQVAEAHVARGDQVWVVDDLSHGSRENVPPEAVFHEVDVADPQFGDVVGNAHFDLVSHHAAQIDVGASVDDPATDARINVLGLINVLESACRPGASRVLFPSSAAVYADAGHGTPPLGEEAPKEPVSPYAIAKLACERYLAFYRETRGIESVTLRYSNVYGPRQSPHRTTGVISAFCGRLVRGDPLTIMGDGRQARDFVFVGDVVEANMVLADLALPADGSVDGRAFNVSSGTQTSVNEIADLLAEASGTDPGRRHVDARAGEVRHSALSPTKLQAVAGWSPRTRLADGLGEALDYVAATLAPARPT